MNLAKRLLSMLLAVAMVLSLMPSFVLAEVAGTTKATWTEVASADALTSVLTNGGNAKLTAGFTYAGGNTLGTNPIVLDLNGQTLTVSGTIFAGSGNLTIIGSGTVKYTATGDGFLKLDGSCVVNIEGGTYIASNKLLSQTGGGSTLNITGGDLTGILQLNYGTMYVSGGIIRTQINPVAVSATKAKLYVSGGAVELIRYQHLNAGSIVSVTGGTVNNIIAASGALGTISVTGGTFRTAPTAHMPAGYSAVPNADGTVTVMKITEVDTIDEMKTAVANAVDGEIIKLVGNIGVNETWSTTSGNGMTVREDATLDLNGYTLRFHLTDNVVPIQVAAGAKLIIKDSSAAGTGAIEGTAAVDKVGIHVIRNAGELVVESGNFRHIETTAGDANALNTHLIFHQSGATTTILDGSFTVLGSGYAVNKASSYTGVISVSGGTFNKVPAAGFIANGYGAKDNGDGTYSIVTLINSKDAFLAAMSSADNGDVIRLDGDINLQNVAGECIAVSKNITLDLNGYKLNYLLTSGNYTPITVSSGASLTATDNSVAGTGAVIGILDSSNSDGRHLIANYGTLTIEKGHFAIEKKANDETQYNSTACVVITYENSATYIEGGSFDSVTTGKLVYMAYENAQMHITGGVYTKEPVAEYLDMYYNAIKHNDGTYVVSFGEICTADDLVNAITNGGSYILKKNFTVDATQTLTVKATTRIEFDDYRITINANHNSNVIGLVNKDTTLSLHAMSGGGITAIYNSTNTGNVCAMFRVNRNGASAAAWTYTHLQIHGGVYELLEGENEGYVRPATTVTMFNVTGDSTASASGSAAFYTEYNHMSSGSKPALESGVRSNVDLTSSLQDPTNSKLRLVTVDGIDWYVIDTDPWEDMIEVDSAAELKYYLTMGLNVKLVADIDYTLGSIVLDGDKIGTGQITVDLNGYDINVCLDPAADRFIDMARGADLKITGNGTVAMTITAENNGLNTDGTDSSEEAGAFMFRVNSSTLTIENGTFTRVLTDDAIAEGGTDNTRQIIYANGEGAAVTILTADMYNGEAGAQLMQIATSGVVLTIHDGTFRTNGGYPLYLNGATATIGGGSFTGGVISFNGNTVKFNVGGGYYSHRFSVKYLPANKTFAEAGTVFLKWLISPVLSRSTTLRI